MLKNLESISVTILISRLLNRDKPRLLHIKQTKTMYLKKVQAGQKRWLMYNTGYYIAFSKIFIWFKKQVQNLWWEFHSNQSDRSILQWNYAESENFKRKHEILWYSKFRELFKSNLEKIRCIKNLKDLSPSRCIVKEIDLTPEKFLYLIHKKSVDFRTLNVKHQ